MSRIEKICIAVGFSVFLSLAFYLLSLESNTEDNLIVPGYPTSSLVASFESKKNFKKFNDEFAKYDVDYSAVYETDSGKFLILFNIKNEKDKAIAEIQSKDYVMDFLIEKKYASF